MGAEGFHGRVRDGIGCFAPRYGHQADQTAPLVSKGPSGKKASNARDHSCLFEKDSPPRRSVLVLAAGHDAQARHRAISTGQLHRLPCFHLRPINVVVYHGPYLANPVGNLILERASHLDAFSAYPDRTSATQRCSWRNNWYTGGPSIPVLSY